MYTGDTLVVLIVIMLIAFMGWKLRLLTIGGGLGAVGVGIFVYFGYSYQGLILLGSFFGTSSLLSKYQRKRKTSLEEMLVKGDVRDIVQVMANGGIPALLGVVQILLPGEDQSSLLGFSIALAAANADTWASEIGTLSKQQPRLLLTLKRVAPGTSGAVTMLGTGAAFAGAALISILAGVLYSFSFLTIVMLTFFGFLGSLIDTLLGQTFQIKYRCNACRKITEKPIHCQVPSEKMTSWSFLNNDGVNFISVGLAAILGMLLM